MKYIIDTPYPSIDGLTMNIQYAELMLSNLGGLLSEMNAVTLYFYNHIILEECWKELADAMLIISKVEMHHLDIFAKMCYRLGADPRLWNCHDDLLNYWSPGYNVYPRQILAILDNAILQEKKTIDIYQYQINCIDDSIISNMLKRIIEDEELHVQIFQHFINEYHQKYTNE